jgi:4-amino-4-deoxy-L-arabinose transferase-like glycosyltransferase
MRGEQEAVHCVNPVDRAAEPLGFVGSVVSGGRRYVVLRFVTFFLAFSALLVVQFARSMNRDLDPDEHQFVAPPALLAQFHLRPYVDYPYFHMPDLVLIYAGLTGWTSWKLLAARTISAICGSATIALLFATGWSWLGGLRGRERWVLAGGVSVVFASSRLFTYTSGWAWNHDTAVLAALGAVLLHLRGMRKGSVELILLAGFFAGLAMGIRLSFALLPIPLAVSLLAGETSLPRRWRWLALLGAMVMALAALLPAAQLAVAAPQRFVFGNLGYPHLSTAYYRTWNRHGMTLIGKVGQSLQKFVSDPGDAVLLAGFVIAMCWSARAPLPRHRFVVLLGVLAALWIGVLGPTPIQPQYNYMLLPFMVLVIFDRLGAQADRVAASKRLHWGVAIAAGVCGSFAMVAWYGPALLHLPTPGKWKPVMQHRLALWVAEQAGAGARVLTIEPTIPLEAGLAVYPQFATGRFVLLVTPFEPAAERARFGMVGRTELAALLAADPPDAVLVQRVEAKNQVDQPFIDYARGHGYRAVVSADGRYVLWVARGKELAD